jgi:hypothetical protein
MLQAAKSGGMMIAQASGKISAGGQMARSLPVSNSSSDDSKARRRRDEIDKDKPPTEIPPNAPSSYTDRNWAGSTWNDALCCDARNALQVILSGAEILLEDHLGNLLASQKELLTKMTDNTYHLCNLLSTLLGPEEFKVEEPSEERLKAVRRAPAKV